MEGLIGRKLNFYLVAVAAIAVLAILILAILVLARSTARAAILALAAHHCTIIAILVAVADSYTISHIDFYILYTEILCV